MEAVYSESKSNSATPNPAKVEAFAGRMLGDLAVAGAHALVYLGDQLGLFIALSRGPATAEKLANRAGLDARYVREWASGLAAIGYLTYDAESGKFNLPPEHAAVLADESSPTFMAAASSVIRTLYHSADEIAEAFRTGDGFGWHQHHQCLFRGTERFFRPGYRNYLVSEWLPKLEGMIDKVSAGGTVLDVGCGHGASTIIMAEAFPHSFFVGIDYHADSIQAARRAAVAAGVEGRVEFLVAGARDIPTGPYDLICYFDCLHDMGDPVGAAQMAADNLKAGGSLMLVEPLAHDSLEDNFNPLGALYYAASTFLCTPCSRSQKIGLALGAQAGPARLSAVLQSAGFSRVRVATESMTNLVIEARL
ncbi:class I SAM-dependent methyltransferase [Microbulbifer hainanensis]|uniref:class I SAM-dependent methyltransferase n=1 Tax=Microbulbifer hainanensis TaxID=2735675 RepID=UPI0018666312|nr:class I SAM-dependent methyltransferase [Microbulbifer hainanensis]